MHVSSPVSPAPAAPRSDARADAPRDSDFGSVYEAGERRPSGAEARRGASDAPHGEAADTGKTAAPRDKDAASAPAKDRGQEKSPEADEADAGPGVETGGAPVVETEAEPAAAETPIAETPKAEAEEQIAAAGEQEPELPAEAPLAAAESPTPRKPSVEAGETKAPRGAPQPNGQVTAQAEDGAAMAASTASAEEPAPDAPLASRETSAPKSATAQPAAQAAQPAAQAAQPAAQAAQPAAQVAQPAQAAARRPVATEEVTVRRVRAEEPAATSSPEVRTESPRAEVTAPKPATPAAAPVDPLAKLSVESVRPDMVDPALAEIAPTEGRSTADHVARAEATVRHDTPRPVMQQVAEAARALRDGPVELTLQPEELGKVKMTLSAGADGTMTLTVQTERPETLDLLRRHIGDLARELQDMGFDNLSFSFGQDRASAGRQQELPREDDAGDAPLAAIPLAQHGFAARSAQTVTVGGLDLRL